MWGHVMGRTGSGLGQVVSTCDGGNAPLDSVKCVEFLD
jgi:hypothetical protein